MSVCRDARRFARSASAPLRASSASVARWRTSGLLSIRMTEFAETLSPARALTSSMMASSVAGIHRTSSGTRVPTPCTCRSISPRLTVSTQTVARSTDGAAGFNRLNPRVRPASTITTTTEMTIRLILLFRATDCGRATSIISSISSRGQFVDFHAIFPQRSSKRPVVVHECLRVTDERLDVRCFGIRDVALLLQDETQLRCAELKLLLLRFKLDIRKLERLFRRRDLGLTHGDHRLRIPDFEGDLLRHLRPLGLQRILLCDSAGVIGQSGFVRERNRKVETERVTRVVVTEQLAKGVAQTTADNTDDIRSTQSGPEGLDAADATLSITCADRQIREQLVLRELNIDVAVLKLQCELPHLGTAFKGRFYAIGNGQDVVILGFAR